MKVLLIVCLLASLWQLSRYGVFSAAGRVAERSSFAPAAQVVTLFGASNFSRGPLAEVLEDLLGVPVRIVAAPGANSDWALTQTDVAFAKGGIVVISFTGNDSALHRGMPMRRSVENHRILRQRAAGSGARVILTTGAPAFHGLRGLARPGAAAYAHAVILDAPEAGVLDEGKYVRDQPGIMPDGLHLSDDAIARLIAPAFAEAISPLLRPCCLRPPS